MGEARREARVRRLLIALLAIYPAAFRRAVGDDLIETAIHRWRDARRRSRWTGAALFWCTEGIRFVVDGVLERVRGVHWILDDITQAWRQLRRAPGHHALAIGTLALGIGATTTIFTVADAVVFRPLPYAGSDALYLIHSRFGATELSSNSLPNLRDLQSSVKTLSWLAGAHDRSPALTGGAGEAERVSALDVTAGYLPGLGARVLLGRAFAVGDHAAGAERVVILSAALWRRRWGGDASVQGETVRLDGVEHVVIGVMAGSFRDPEPIESGAVTGVWIPTREGHGPFEHRDNYAFRVLGRIAEESSLESARLELSAAGGRLAAAYPDVNSLGGDSLDFVMHPLHEMTVGEARARLLMLTGAVVLLLALSCANVANLFLARAVMRTSELTARSALGATRARLAIQLFGESLLTAAFAGAVGGVLGVIGLRVFTANAPQGVPRLHEVGVDTRALVFVVALTVITAATFGMLPALRGSRSALLPGSGARTTGSRHTQRLQSGLVAIEVAIALVLVTGSALLLNSMMRMLRVHPGFDGSDVTVVDLRPPFSAKSHAEELAFHRALLERAVATPGVSNVALAYTVPGHAGGAWTRVSVEGDAPAAGGRERTRAPALGSDPGDDFFRFNPVYGRFFEAMDIPLRAGRTFEGDPGDSDPLVVMLNQAAARHFFPGVDRVVGRRLGFGPRETSAPMREVVGIVGDVRQRGAGQDAEPQIYVPYAQRDVDRLSLVLESRPGVVLTGDVIRRLVRDVAPDVPVDGFETLSDSYAATSDPVRFLAFLLSIFGGIGLLLACVGTYAIVSHVQSRRVRELGIRMALGAKSRTVFGLVLSRAMLIAGSGIAAGLLLALALAQFLEAYVFGITARDPLTLAVAALLIAACAALASLGPALRAARVQPNEVLRSE